MSVVKDILKSLDKINNTSSFDKYKLLIKKYKKLPKKEYMELQKIVRTKELYKILNLNLNNLESRILGKILTTVKLSHVDDIIHIICNKNDESTPILLTYILSKKNKIDLSDVSIYIKKMINGHIKLVHLGLLNVVYKNYPFLIDNEILEFCRKNDHEICKEICSLEMETI